MKVRGDWSERPSTRAVLEMLVAGGHQAFFVGGCVRNSLLGEPVKDIDIATDACPQRVIDLAEGAGYQAIPTGKEHGTVTVISDHLPHEITTFRRDVVAHGRHATVAFSDDINQDARRRDFTMNALYASLDGTVTDPLGGLADLRARRVRFIEDPGQRIREDYLRILRFFRFHAWYGDPDAGMDPEALAAIGSHLDGLAQLSRERVGAEVTKLLSAPDPAPSVAAMRIVGVLARILPGAADRGLAPLVQLEAEADAAPDAMRRLAALGGDDVAARLRLSRTEARALAVLREAAASTRPAFDLGYRLGHAAARSVLLLRSALLEQPFDPVAAAQAEQGAGARFPVSAADLPPDLTGPALGQRLRALEAAWLASGCRLTKAQLIAAQTDD